MAKVITPGVQKLKRWMAAGSRRERGQTAIGRMLGVSQPAVRAWCTGESRPEPPYREALERLAGIPLQAWELPEERADREAREQRIEAAAPPKPPAPATKGKPRPSRPPAPASTSPRPPRRQAARRPASAGC